MTDTASYIDMLKKFGTDLGLPKPNVDQLVETQKNIEAPGPGAQVIAQGAQSMAQKQRELVEAGLREATAFARENQAQINANIASRRSLRARCLKLPSREPRRPRPPRDNRALMP